MFKVDVEHLNKWLVGQKIEKVGYDKKNNVLSIKLSDGMYLVVLTDFISQALEQDG